jgi:hypothetical protein
MEVGTFLNYRDCLLLSLPPWFSPVPGGFFISYLYVIEYPPC